MKGKRGAGEAVGVDEHVLSSLSKLHHGPVFPSNLPERQKFFTERLTIWDWHDSPKTKHFGAEKTEN